jgi:hypothetical protein
VRITDGYFKMFWTIEFFSRASRTRGHFRGTTSGSPKFPGIDKSAITPCPILVSKHRLILVIVETEIRLCGFTIENRDFFKNEIVSLP